MKAKLRPEMLWLALAIATLIAAFADSPPWSLARWAAMASAYMPMAAYLWMRRSQPDPKQGRGAVFFLTCVFASLLWTLYDALDRGLDFSGTDILALGLNATLWLGAITGIGAHHRDPSPPTPEEFAKAQAAKQHSALATFPAALLALSAYYLGIEDDFNGYYRRAFGLFVMIAVLASILIALGIAVLRRRRSRTA